MLKTSWNLIKQTLVRISLTEKYVRRYDNMSLAHNESQVMHGLLWVIKWAVPRENQQCGLCVKYRPGSAYAFRAGLPGETLFASCRFSVSGLVIPYIYRRNLFLILRELNMKHQWMVYIRNIQSETKLTVIMFRFKLRPW